METLKICPNCRKPLPPDVPLGLCPECLIKSGFPTGTEPGGAAEAAAARFVPPPVGEIAQLFPQLEIIRLIGKGGMGAVYKARQPALDRFVALKVLPPAMGSDPGFAERFNREARALARLNHPNIVAVHDFGKAGSLHYLLMEFVDGANLREVEQAGALTPEQALAIVPQICEALQFAHDEGIVHRDIKPENLLLDKKGRVKITDFGIAKIIGQAPQDVSLTGAKDIVGTPHYMAPEQLEKPRSVDHRADIYSLGVVFYEMLTGELPLGKFAPPSKITRIDVRLDEVVLHTLEKEPDRRYQHASQVKTAVENIRHTAAPPSGAESGARVQAILDRDYVLDIGSCLRRGWGLVRGNFWPLFGVTALVLLLLALIGSAGGSFERSSSGVVSANSASVLGLLALGPLMGGLCLFFLKKIRGEPVNAETAFSGFSHRFLHLLLAGLVTSMLTGFGFLCLILPGIYLLVAWTFTFPLVIDKQLDFWPAMELSRKLVTKHWWKFLGFWMVLVLLNFAGVLACLIGFFVTAPVVMATLMFAYEDIFNAAPKSLSAAADSSPVAAPLPPGKGKWPWLLACAGIAGVIVIALTIVLFVLLKTGLFAGLHRAGEELKVTAPVPPPVRIKAGLTKSFTDSAGNVWLPDQGFSGGETSERSGDLSIANTPDPALYHSERYGMTSFSYPVPNGKYVVKLYFAETYDGITGPGQRVFSFNVQGQEFSDFDIWATAGGARHACVETANVEVSDGKLNIRFTPRQENPEINGVEILPATPVPPVPSNPPVPPVAPATPVPPTATAAPGLTASLKMFCRMISPARPASKDIAPTKSRTSV